MWWANRPLVACATDDAVLEGIAAGMRGAGVQLAVQSVSALFEANRNLVMALLSGATALVGTAGSSFAREAGFLAQPPRAAAVATRQRMAAAYIASVCAQADRLCQRP